jgi:hypothetical protein
MNSVPAKPKYAILLARFAAYIEHHYYNVSFSCMDGFSMNIIECAIGHSYSCKIWVVQKIDNYV